MINITNLEKLVKVYGYEIVNKLKIENMAKRNIEYKRYYVIIKYM